MVNRFFQGWKIIWLGNFTNFLGTPQGIMNWDPRKLRTQLRKIIHAPTPKRREFVKLS